MLAINYGKLFLWHYVCFLNKYLIENGHSEIKPQLVVNSRSSGSCGQLCDVAIENRTGYLRSVPALNYGGFSLPVKN
jgi:hypothetical protein